MAETAGMTGNGRNGLNNRQWPAATETAAINGNDHNSQNGLNDTMICSERTDRTGRRAGRPLDKGRLI
jgi:hypothetical protein